LGEKKDFGYIGEVRVLGALALIDEGEVDWKVLAIDNQEFADIKTLDDLNFLYPDRLKEIVKWFMFYKTTDGKKANRYAFGARPTEIEETLILINDLNHSWKRLHVPFPK
jgi:inorganic pyrophosphatase